MKKNILKPLLLHLSIITLVISLFIFSACQIETPSFSLPETQDIGITKPQAPDSTSDTPVTNDEGSTPIIPTEARVQFDPAYGTFYYANRQPSQNPINITSLTGDPIVSPQNSSFYKAIPYKEGCRFMGWVRDYPYPGKTFEEKNFWDFEKDIVMGNMSLYAYFEESDIPDSKPIVPASSTPSSSSGNSSRLYDYPVQGVPSISDFTNVNKEGLYEFFATGVTQTKGWINNVQYKNNCWATATSQMIYWYQNQINELAKTKPDVRFTATENPIQTDEKVLELRDWFNDWRGFQGGHIEWALEKYFQEKLDSRRMEDIVSYHCGDGYAFTLESLSKILLKHLSRGDMCGLTAVNFDGGLHAMNIYGAAFNDQGIVEVIYVTSSPTLESEELIKQHVPRLYKFYQDGKSERGAQSWLATYEVRKDGYISTSQASIQNIYRLDFLTMKQYE